MEQMKISARVRYALRFLKDLEEHRDDGAATTEMAVAKRQGLSQKFLSRIVLPLRDAKIVKARQGSRAGFSLLRKLEDITLLELIETVDGPINLLDCLRPEEKCERVENCYAHRLWARANADIRRCLAAITLSNHAV